MADKPKDYTSTIMRMAGNIAAGMMGAQKYQDWLPCDVADQSVIVAREIVRIVTESPHPPASQAPR